MKQVARAHPRRKLRKVGDTNPQPARGLQPERLAKCEAAARTAGLALGLLAGRLLQKHAAGVAGVEHVRTG